MHDLLWGHHAREFASCSSKSCNDGCTLLLWLKVGHQHPNGDVGDVGPEAVGRFHLRAPARWYSVVELPEVAHRHIAAGKVRCTSGQHKAEESDTDYWT